MKALLRTLLLASLLVIPGFCVAGDLEDVNLARTLLPEAMWSRILLIKNTKPDDLNGRRVHALVFEFGRVLWIYIPNQGTRSISRMIGGAERDNEHLNELLGIIHPGFVAHRVLEPDPPRPSVRVITPPNACFLRSVKALFHAALEEGGLRDTALLCFYFKDGRGSGHTVLSYRTDAGCFVVDPSISGKAVRVEADSLSDPLLFAKAVHKPSQISTARFFRIEVKALPRLPNGSPMAAKGEKRRSSQGG